MTPKQKLEAHSSEFRKEIFSFSEKIHFAVGYGASNATLIEADNSLIIVDTLESTSAAKELLVDFRKISNKPINTIIYTHSHRDHVSGATVFAGKNNPTIIARPAQTNMLGAKEVADISVARARRQFAINEPEWVRINLGIGPAERPLTGLGAGILPATQLVTGEREKHLIDGIEVELVAAPGETADTMLVWLPKKRILIGADNYYKSFPNLYPVRGSVYRDVAKWVESLDIMREFEADVLLPGHTRPVTGSKTIQSVLKDYRDGIAHILDTTLLGMNQGLTTDQLAEVVTLPPHLADKPYLQEYYGSVAWSVRAIFTGYLGWFDGNPTNLFPLPAREEAKKMAELVGGEEKLLDAVKTAVSKKEYQWALQLADHLLALEVHLDQARKLKCTALKALADQQINATARNYYLSYAHELCGEL